MICSICGLDQHEVLETRPREKGFVVYRRRHCLKCGNRWSTYERIADKDLVEAEANELVH